MTTEEFTNTYCTRCENYNGKNFRDKEKELLLDLICEKQIHIILKNHENYESKKYQNLEELKVKIKDM